MTGRRSLQTFTERMSRQAQFVPGHVGGRVASAQPVRRRASVGAIVATEYGWTQRTPIPTGIDPENIRGVAYGAGTWVAVGTAGGVWQATDPTGTWTYEGDGTIESVDFDDFYTVAYGDGAWVAGGATGKLYWATNPAGPWTSISLFASTETVESIAYGNGLWVANAVHPSTGNNTYTATDPTGTWTHRTGLDSAVDIAAIAYGAGTWVAFGGWFDVTYTATDPTGAWVERSTEALPAGGSAVDVGYGAGKWVAFVDYGSTAGYVAWTNDPTTTGAWTSVDAGFVTEFIRAGGYGGGGLWLAMGPDASSGEARATATDPTLAAP